MSGVSIPLWCDLKVFTDDEIQDALDKVSIPLWCDLKRLTDQIRAARSDVSIPLWCDLKPGGLVGSGRGSWVSIPLWWDLKSGRFCAVEPGNLVSIPLWCDLKTPLGAKYTTVAACFHPTMVRFKDNALGSGRGAPFSFHPTMVRFKDSAWVRSTPTGLVSIPLWCDLKRVTACRLLRPGASFHPTMVRFKAQRGRGITDRAHQFPSHYGAI